MSKTDSKKINETYTRTFALKPWIPDLAKQNVNDDKWYCYCAMIIEAKPFYRAFTNEFETICQYGYRKYVRCITMSDIIKEIWVNSTKKGINTPLAHLCDEIRRSAGKHIEKSMKIPAPLLASLIKYIILDMKQRDIQRKENLKLINSLSKTSKLNNWEKKSVSTKSSVTESHNKITTKLHKRGEEMKFLVSVMDCPPNGPDLYIFLLQFQDVILPFELYKVGILLTSIIQVGYSDLIMKGDNNKQRQKMKLNAKRNKIIRTSVAESLLSGEVYLQRITLFQDIRYFWIEFFYYLRDVSYFNCFKDLAIMKYIPTLHFKPTSIHFLEDLRTDIYNGMITIMYDIVCLKSCYESHLEQMDVIDFEETETVDLEDLSYYNNVLNNIPLEALTISLILDTLLAEVCLNIGDGVIGYEIQKYSFLFMDKEESNKPTKIIWLKELIEKLNIENYLFETDEAEGKRKHSSENIRESVIPVIREDDITLNSIHIPSDLREFIKERSIYLIQLFWDKTLWEKVTDEIFSPNHFKNCINQMASYLKTTYSEDIITMMASLTEIERSFCSPIEKFNNLLTENETDSTRYMENLVFNLKHHCKTDSILNKRDVQREMGTDVLLQKLDREFSDAGCLAWKYFPFLNKILCKLFDFSKPRKKEVVLPTLVTFRDFVECVFFDKIVDWEAIEKQFRKNKIYYDNHEVNFFDQEISYNLIFPLNVNGMRLNYIDCIPRNSSEYQLVPEKTDSSSDEKYENVLSFISSVDSGRKEEELEFSQKYIYDTGTRRRTVFSFSDTELSFNPGLKMGLKFEGELIESMLLTFVAKFRGVHNINYHKVLVRGKRSTAQASNHKSTLTIQHTSGIIFSIYKIKDPTDGIDLKLVDSTQSQYTQSVNSSYADSLFTNFSSSTNDVLISGKFNFTLSWPSGLQINLVPREGLQYYIKQNYIYPSSNSLTKISDEMFRCFLPEGIVLKFMKDNTVILLHANGKIIHCYEYQWITVGDDKNDDNNKNNSNERLELTKNVSLILLKYRIRFPDGKIKIFEKGSWISGKKMYVTDFYNIIENECVTECSDDTFVHKKDGFLSVTYSDGTKISSQAKFHHTPFLFEHFFNDGDTSNFGFPLDFFNNTIYNQSDEFVLVEIDYYKMQHPYFATTVYSLNPPNTVELELPHGITLKYYEDGNIFLDLKEEVKVFSDEMGKIVATESFEGKIRNNIIFSLDCEIGNRPAPCVTFTDNMNNSMIIDDTGDVKTNETLNKNINHAMNESFFVFDKNYNGFQYHTVDEVKNSLIPIKNNIYSLIKVDKNDAFAEYLVMVPLSTDMPWKMETNGPETQEKQNTISTYGPSWAHPFKIDSSTGHGIHLQKAMILQMFKKLNFGGTPRAEFLNLLSKFKIEDVNLIEPDASTRHVPSDQYFLKEPSKMVYCYRTYYQFYLDECEKTKREKWLERYIIEPSVLMVIYKKRLKKVAQKYRGLKEKILHREVPPYFENADGNTFYITMEMIKSARQIGRDKLMVNRLDNLLDENLKNISSKDLMEMKRLLEKDKRGIWCKTKKSKYLLEEVLEAGSSLYPYFKNMRAVLTFHKNMTKDID